MALTASMALRTCSGSRSPSVPGATPAFRPPRLLSESMGSTSTSSTRTRLSSSSYIARSSSSVGGRSCSLIHGSIGRARLAHGLGVDVAQRGTPVERPPLALRAVELGQCDIQAMLGPDGLRPGQGALQRGPRVLLLAAGEVDEAPVHAVADRPPHVLLDETAGEGVVGLALVVVARRLEDRRGDQRGKRLGLPCGDLGVAEAHLDRPEA